MNVCTCSSTFENPRGDCERHTTDTQQEIFGPLPIGLLPKQGNMGGEEERKGDNLSQCEVASEREVEKTEIAIITWCASGTS